VPARGRPHHRVVADGRGRGHGRGRGRGRGGERGRRAAPVGHPLPLGQARRGPVDRARARVAHGREQAHARVADRPARAPHRRATARAHARRSAGRSRAARARAHHAAGLDLGHDLGGARARRRVARRSARARVGRAGAASGLRGRSPEGRRRAGGRGRALGARGGGAWPRAHPRRAAAARRARAGLLGGRHGPRRARRRHGPRQDAPDALRASRGRTLVVCPTSVLHNWAARSKRFRPSLSVASTTARGARSTRRRRDAHDVRGAPHSTSRRSRRSPGHASCSTRRRPSRTPTARRARGLRAEGELPLALSGTPVENRLEELWSLLHFTNPGLLGGARDFDERFARPIESGRPRPRRAAAQEGIRPFVLRRIKKTSRPSCRRAPRRQLLRASSTIDERAVYDAVRAATRRPRSSKRLGEGGERAGRARGAVAAAAGERATPRWCPARRATTSSKLERS
jgi:hypothetical protein